MIKPGNNESGQALVEFALVVSLLLLIFFGIIEFGRIYHAHLVITSAAREGARTAIVNNTNITNAITNATASLNPTTIEEDPSAKSAPNSAPPSGYIYWCKNEPEGNGVGKPVEIYVKGSVEIITPIISSITGPRMSIPGKAVMMIER